MEAENETLNSFLENKYGSETRKSVREYGKLLHKKVRWKNIHIFFMRCRDEEVLPVSLRVKPLVRTKEGFRIARTTSIKFLKESIRDSYRKTEELICTIKKIENKLLAIMIKEDYDKVTSICSSSAEKELKKCEE